MTSEYQSYRVFLNGRKELQTDSAYDAYNKYYELKNGRHDKCVVKVEGGNMSYSSRRWNQLPEFDWEPIILSTN